MTEEFVHGQSITPHGNARQEGTAEEGAPEESTQDEATTREEEVLPPGEVTQDAQGLGQVYGDADRMALDEPVAPPNPRDAAVIEDLEENYTVRETEDGGHYLEEDDQAIRLQREEE